MRKLVLVICAACGADPLPADGVDTVTAEVDGATFAASEVGVNVGSAQITLQTTGRQAIALTFPRAAGSYSCATQQSGVVTIGLDYADLDTKTRARAGFSAAGSSCTLEVTSFAAASGERFTGTFSGHLIGLDTTKPPIIVENGAFDVGRP
jgi:hypothetical protein